MNLRCAPLASLLLSACVAVAQTPAPYSPPDPALTGPATGGSPLRSTAELESLLAPIALYPDALIALILPAATAPAEIVLASRLLRESSANRPLIEQQAWDESVKSLAYYPDVLKWMDENLEWTKQVGEAFITQPAEVMQAVQRLRAQARAAGTLIDTSQQQVLTDLDVIRIVPTQPNVIYVPYYEPAMVFVRQPLAYPSSRITFGLGLSVGSWLAFECDWRRHTIWVGNRHRAWTSHDWRRPLVPVPLVASAYSLPAAARPWRPAPASHHRPAPPPRRPSTVTGPQPFSPTVARTFNRGSAGIHSSRDVDRGGSSAPSQGPLSLAPLSTPQVVAASPVVVPFGRVPAGPQAENTATPPPGCFLPPGSPRAARHGRDAGQSCGIVRGFPPTHLPARPSGHPVGPPRRGLPAPGNHQVNAHLCGPPGAARRRPDPTRSHPAPASPPGGDDAPRRGPRQFRPAKRRRQRALHRAAQPQRTPALGIPPRRRALTRRRPAAPLVDDVDPSRVPGPAGALSRRRWRITRRGRGAGTICRGEHGTRPPFVS